MKDSRQIFLTAQQIYLIREEFAERYKDIKNDLDHYEFGLRSYPKDVIQLIRDAKTNYYEIVSCCNEAIKDCYDPINLEL
jgi:hypothetical protein